MTSRAPPPALRRLICGILLAVALIVPIVLWILSTRANAPDPDSVISLVRVCSVAAMLLMVWSFAYVEKETGMARVALASTALVFAIMTFQVRSFSNDSTAVAPNSDESATVAKGGSADKAEKTGKTVTTGKAETDIVGKWRSADTGETDEFFKDGTILFRNKAGETTFFRYAFLASNRLQLLSYHGDPKNPFICDVSVKADTLSMTSAGQTTPETYQREQTPKDKAGLAGMWHAVSGAEVVISTDGSFVFNDDDGPWNWTGQEFVAKSLVKNGSTWRLALSADGRTLSGTWSAPDGKSGNATLTRHPTFENLAAALVGKWQLAGHGETNEFRKDGTAIVSTDDGKVFTLQYSTPDANHFRMTKSGIPPLVWEVMTITEDRLTLVREGFKPATYLRVF